MYFKQLVKELPVLSVYEFARISALISQARVSVYCRV